MTKMVSFFLAVIFTSCVQNKKSEKLYIYYENGTIRREFQVIDGKHEGLMLDFYPTGKKKVERQMHNDIQVGKTIIYHEDGEKIKEIQYFDQNGNREKGDTIWYYNGNIEFISQFYNDKKNGLLTKYDTTGTLIYSAKFQNDTLLKVIKEVK
jgi:uncharacterized protein